MCFVKAYSKYSFYYFLLASSNFFLGHDLLVGMKTKVKEKGGLWKKCQGGGEREKEETGIEKEKQNPSGPAESNSIYVNVWTRLC